MSINIKPQNRGKLHRALGVPQGQPIPAAKEAKAKKNASPALKKEIQFAQNAMKWHHTKKPKSVKTDRGEFGMK